MISHCHSSSLSLHEKIWAHFVWRVRLCTSYHRCMSEPPPAPQLAVSGLYEINGISTLHVVRRDSLFVYTLYVRDKCHLTS